MYNDKNFPVNYMTAEKLIELLKSLPKEALVVPNPCYNLNVHLNNKWLGTIEFGIEEFTIWEI
jgi:hypothetical protein